MAGVRRAAQNHDDAPHGTSQLPGNLTQEQLVAAPVLVSIDSLVIDELSQDEDVAFAAALGS